MNLELDVDVAVIGALQPEVDGLIAEMSEYTCERVSGIDFYVGRLYGRKVALCKSGMGKVFAALAAEIMMIKYTPDILVNTGTGGALAPDLKTGDIIVARDLCQHDVDTTPLGNPLGMIPELGKVYFEADKKATKVLLSAAKTLGLTAREGRVASGDYFVHDEADKARIVKDFNADICEMEGGAVAQVAAANGIPFAIIRAAANSADGNSDMDFAEFMPMAAENSLNIVKSIIKDW